MTTEELVIELEDLSREEGDVFQRAAEAIEELQKDKERLITALNLHFQNHLTETHPKTRKCNCGWWATEREFCQAIDAAMQPNKPEL